jgi:hypothetical protein
MEPEAPPYPIEWCVLVPPEFWDEMKVALRADGETRELLSSFGEGIAWGLYQYEFRWRRIEEDRLRQIAQQPHLRKIERLARKLHAAIRLHNASSDVTELDDIIGSVRDVRDDTLRRGRGTPSDEARTTLACWVIWQLEGEFCTYPWEPPVAVPLIPVPLNDSNDGVLAAVLRLVLRAVDRLDHGIALDESGDSRDDLRRRLRNWLTLYSGFYDRCHERYPYGPGHVRLSSAPTRFESSRLDNPALVRLGPGLLIRRGPALSVWPTGIFIYGPDDELPPGT